MNPTGTSSIVGRTTVGPPGVAPGADEEMGPASTDEAVGYLEEIRSRSMDPANAKLGVWLLGRGLRRLGLAPKSMAAGVVGLLAGVGIRMPIAVAITALAGQWTGLPWGRWVAIAVFLSLLDVGRLRHHAPSEKAEQEEREATALLETIERESDLRDLVRFGRWYRTPVNSTLGAGLAAVILLACWWASPDGMASVPAGSIAMLALLLFDLGEIAAVALWDVTFVRRQAACAHRLFWLDPVNSPAVRQQMRVLAFGAFAFGMQVTVAMILAIVLVSPSSPVVIPLAAGITIIGYAAILAMVIGERSSIGKIVQRSRDRHLAVLQARLEVYEPGSGTRAASEPGEFDQLITLYGALRDASTHPRWTTSLGQTAVALLVPTLMFVITVFGEVSAERLLERILP